MADRFIAQLEAAASDPDISREDLQALLRRAILRLRELDQEMERVKAGILDASARSARAFLCQLHISYAQSFHYP